MRTDPRPDEVRRIVERVFSGYLATAAATGDCLPEAPFPRICRPWEEANALEIEETILIDQSRYVARSYRAEGYLAMWLVAVGLVQFYNQNGRMLASINLFESLRPQRLAA